RPEIVLALADELVIHLVRSHDVLEFLEREIEDVFLLTKHLGLHEALGFFEQGLLVDEVAADHAILRVLPIAYEGADPVDHPLGGAVPLLSVRHGRLAPAVLRLVVPGYLPSWVEALLAGAGRDVLNVAAENRQQRCGAFAPARPRHVHLADPAHAVLVEP